LIFPFKINGVTGSTVHRVSTCPSPHESHLSSVLLRVREVNQVGVAIYI